MKNSLRVILIIVILFLMTSFIDINVITVGIDDNGRKNRVSNDLFEVGNNSLNLDVEQDGRFIEKLEWFSPNGELPGNYSNYLSKHALSSAFFSEPMKYNVNLQSEREKISILVNTALYLLIKDSLNQYIDDLNSEGCSITVQTVLGGLPNEIKEWVIDSYNQGSTGFVFIGDITAAWAEVSGDVFPCDLFYMDLDGNWNDLDNDGDYEIHTAGIGDMGPEVFVGRINAYTLNYDTEANMINDYLNKVHAYRIGELTQPWRGLEYVEEDWYDMDVFLRLIYGDDVVRYDSGFDTTAKDYLDQMDLGQHFTQVCVHSYSGGHYFSTRPTESASYAHIYVYSPVSRSAKLLLGCDDGIKVWLNSVNIYTNDRYGEWNQDDFEVNVNLNAGWNQLLCKVSQGGGDYKISARFTDLDYNSFNDLRYQINNPEINESEGDYIRSWLLNGFHQDILDDFWNYLKTNYLGVDETSINPSEGQVMGGKIWSCYDSGYPYINLGEYCNNADYGVCYAFVRVFSDTYKSCQLWMGYDDGARVWLNGNEVLYDNRYGGFESDMSKVNVSLQAGGNRLLVKISEWMGEHGFSARFCQSNGIGVDGLTYDPEPTPINFIGTWLIDGPYFNPDQVSRLSTDYLGDESDVKPNEGNSAPIGTWERGIGDGCPFNIGGFFDNGSWVLSEDIQERDPPVLFYNLFACGPGRFTDDNYLAGAYIFNTTYGLIAMASSKSGSMLNFNDFTLPLSEQKNIGEAFLEWFDAQAPYDLWEKEWYYGMVLCGDPMLIVINNERPNIPAIVGPSSGKPKTNYTYTFTATDPDNDYIFYYVDWGDGTNSGWFGPYMSGAGYAINHKWSDMRSYTIKAKVKDTKGAVSDWGVHEVKITRLKSLVYSRIIDSIRYLPFEIK
jgi:hypothetical protein